MILGATMLAMFSLLIFYFRTIRGLLIPLASMVVSIIWGLGFTAFMGFGIDPLILSFLAPPKVKRHSLIELEGDDAMEMQSKKGLYCRVVDWLYRCSNPGNRWGVVAAILLILFGGGYVTTTCLKVGDAAAGAAILYPDHPYNVSEKKMNTDFMGASRLIVIIKGKEKEAIKNKNSLDTMQKLAVFMQQNIEDVGGTLSLTDLVESIYRNYHEGSPKWEMVPQNQQHLGQIYFMLSCNMAPGEMDQFVSLPDYTNASVTAFMRDYNNESIKNAIAQVKDFARENGADPNSKIDIKLAGGLLGILAAVNEEKEILDARTGKIPLYIEGMPFPNIDMKNDPDGPVKFMHNNNLNIFMQGQYEGLSYTEKGNLQWIGRNRGYERGVGFLAERIYWWNRPGGEIANPRKYKGTTINNVTFPYDMYGTSTLYVRHLDGRPDSVYAYVPAIRRVKRLSGANRSDPQMGSDMTMDDGKGFDGHIKSMKWKFMGEKIMLKPAWKGETPPGN